jgi:hypothetical protein
MKTDFKEAAEKYVEQYLGKGIEAFTDDFIAGANHGYAEAMKESNEDLDTLSRKITGLEAVNYKQSKRIEEVENQLASNWVGEHKRLKEENQKLKTLCTELMRFKPSLLTLIQKDFQYPDNAVKCLEEIEKHLSSIETKEV